MRWVVPVKNRWMILGKVILMRSIKMKTLTVIILSRNSMTMWVTMEP